MTSPSTTLTACLLAALAPLLGSASVAHAAEGDRAAPWVPERSWPGACETDVPTNGLVFLEGGTRGTDAPGRDAALRVFVQRMVGEAPVETIEGKVSFPDANSAVFQAARELAPNADYQLTAQRVSPDGTPLSAPFTSDFTTGSRALAGPAFRTAPTLQLEAFDKEVERCDAAATGDARCVPTGETVPTRYVRVSVPAIEGGLAQRPYAVSAALSTSGTRGDAEVVARADDASVQAGKRSFMLIEVPAAAEGSEGCVTVTARDLAGHTVTSEPVCTQLPGSEENDGEALQYAQAGSNGAEAAESMPAETAGGCAVGTREAGAGSLAWLALALTFSRARSRKRAR